MINPQWLKLPMSQIISKAVWAIEILLYYIFLINPL